MSITTVLTSPHGGAWWRRRFGGLPRPFWLLFAGVFTARLAFFVIPFRTFYLCYERQLSPVQSGLVLAAFGLGWAASMPLGGWCADRFGRRPVIIFSAFGSAIAFLGFGAVHSVAALAVTGCAAGLTFDLYRPAVQARIVDTVPPEPRARALALLYLVLNLGRGVACAVGGLMADRSFWLLFLANAIVNIGFGLTVWLLVPADTPHARHADKRPALRSALRDPALRAFTVITLVFYLVHMQSVISLPAVMNAAGATPLAFGLILALDPLCVAVVQLLLQHRLLPDTTPSRRTRWPAPAVCGTGIALVGIGLAIAGMGTTVWWFAATTPLWVAGEVAVFAVAQGIVAALAPSHLAGVYFGVWGCCQGASALVAPLLSSALVAAGGVSLLWTASAAAGVAAGIACVVFGRRYRLRLVQS